MLIEPSRVRAEDAGYLRRWFTDEDMDLYLWFDADGDLVRLQLCYDKRTDEHVLRWTRGEGYRHDRIDDGEGVPGRARTPILVLDGACDVDRLLTAFRAASESLDAELFELVYERLVGFKYGL